MFRMKGVRVNRGKRKKQKEKRDMYNGRGLFAFITIPEMVFFLFIPTLLKKRWGYYEHLHPSIRPAVSPRANACADECRLEKGPGWSACSHEINGFGFLVPPNQNFDLVVSVPQNIIPQAHVISSDVTVKLQIGFPISCNPMVPSIINYKDMRLAKAPSNCADMQVDLNHHWSLMADCRKLHALAQNF